MSSMYVDKKIIVTMNPDELRALADKMESKFPKLTIGDSTFVGFLCYDKDMPIHLHLDQEWFSKKDK